jgi:hypothetical protein
VIYDIILHINERFSGGIGMNITVLGCGRWGAFHAWYAHHIGHHVTLWGRPGSPHLAELISQRIYDPAQRYCPDGRPDRGAGRG